LVKAVIKSHIIVLAYSVKNKKIIIDKKEHEKVETKTFIHKCYVECSKLFYDHPLLFWHDLPNNEKKDNQRIIYQLIKIGIKNAIKKVLPMKLILDAYLNADEYEDTHNNSNKSYDPNQDPNQEHFMKVKELIKRDLDNDYNGAGSNLELENDLRGGNNGDIHPLSHPQSHPQSYSKYDMYDKVIETSESEQDYGKDYGQDINNANKSLEALIYGRHPVDTIDERTTMSHINTNHVKQETTQPKQIQSEKVQEKISEKIPEKVVEPDPFEVLKNMRKSKKGEFIIPKQTQVQSQVNKFSENNNNTNNQELNIIRNSRDVDNYFDEMLN
jgi:hypothetical protein